VPDGYRTRFARVTSALPGHKRVRHGVSDLQKVARGAFVEQPRVVARATTLGEIANHALSTPKGLCCEVARLRNPVGVFPSISAPSTWVVPARQARAIVPKPFGLLLKQHKVRNAPVHVVSPKPAGTFVGFGPSDGPCRADGIS
jgi:hypothetical protein